MKYLSSVLIVFTLFCSSMIFSNSAKAHCEIPCGIYNDSLRVAMIYEHIQTIEKSMNSINELSEQDKPNYNQLTRWIYNKDEHAEKIQELVCQYFLYQRVKVVPATDKKNYANYLEQLESLHNLLVYSMKSKQSTDLTNVEKLKEYIKKFEKAYFHKH